MNRKGNGVSELLTAGQMRAFERAAMDMGTVTGRDLMERAGRGVVAAIFRHWPDLARAPYRAAVLCGPGNNGGDGLVVARILKEWGWAVDVYLEGDPDRLPPDAAANLERWRTMAPVAGLGEVPRQAGATDLFVDALFGIGLTRALEGEARAWAAAQAADPSVVARTVAVDMPSGLCSDSGRVLGESAVAAALTVTFHRPKPGHHLAEGPERCGWLSVADIGLRREVPPGAIRLCAAPGFGVLAKTGRAHKFTHGHALILSGGAGQTGAARLAARGALRIGAGLVTLGVPGSAEAEVACQITALMLRRVEDGDGLAAVLADRRVNALCLGPGLGAGRARDLVPVAVSAARGTVLDADALTAFEADPQRLLSRLHARCVLTPHDGEFARLFPDIAERLNMPAQRGPAWSRADATREAAKRAGCVVLLKGPDTVIAAPDGRCSISSAGYGHSAPWLATAGAGDVLSGFVTGLLARGLEPMQAAETAAWLHADCARAFGPGLIAEDLPEMLPSVLRRLDGAGAPGGAS